MKRKSDFTDLEIIFNSTHDAISLVEYRGGEFRYLRNNEAHRRLTGYRSIEGKTPAELYGEETGKKLLGYYEQCVKTGEAVNYEQTFDFGPGRRVWLTTLTPVFDRDRLRYLVGSSKDITELKEVEGQNDTLSRRLHSMFTQHNAVMLIINPKTGKIVDANPAACEFYGYAKEELLALNIDRINMLPPEEVQRRYTMAYEQRQRYFVFPHRLKSGEIRLVDVCSCPIEDGETTLLSSIIFDVTDRESYRNDLFREKELLRTTLQSIGDGVVTTDNDGQITDLNAVAQELTGWSIEEAKGRLFTDVFRLRSEETGKAVENPIRKVLETGRVIGLANHTVLMNRLGQAIPVADSAAPIRMEGGKIFGVVMVFRDVSKDKEQSEQIRFLSYHDPLTGLYNRRYIEEALVRLDTPENLPISVIMGDVNGLKITNDVFGHEEGDVLLQRVADDLRLHCGPNGLIARWGGDEFVIFMPHTSLAAAEETVRGIKNDCVAVEGGALRLSISLGCAEKRETYESIQSALQEAEETMYHQKLLDGKSYRNSIINTLLATLFEKSIETEEHAKRLEIFCHSVGQQMRFSSKEMDELSLLALLHDIGKVGVNQSILKKPGRLTPVEWEEMKRHPEIGYRIAQTTPELVGVADYILSHHERWDGAGYPRGLKGEEIPLICRILAVADAYDAMTNDRVYRRAVSEEAAVAELRANAGTQFDPQVVDLFIESALTGPSPHIVH